MLNELGLDIKPYEFFDLNGKKYVGRKRIHNTEHEHCYWNGSCKAHPTNGIVFDGTCSICSYQHFTTGPKPSYTNAIVEYKTCSECDWYEIITHNDTNKFKFNNEYLKIIIDRHRKKKEDEETERLLNLGNPEFPSIMKKVDELEHSIKELNLVINAKDTSITELQNELKKYKELYEESAKNDRIWAAIPSTKKKELIKKYSP